MNTMTQQRPRVVVVGAGFGGLTLAKGLRRCDVDVLILDRNNYHGFWPLLYQVATAGLEPESIAYPVRGLIRKWRNVNFEMAEVRGIDLAHQLVITDGAKVPYDYLVLAAGSANNYFGNNSLEQCSYGLKDIDQAQRLRNHVLGAFERAVREGDPVRRKALMTFVIVGAGPTGVELAGAFSELITHVLRMDFPILEVKEARVVLVEATDKLLASFPQVLQQRARRTLEIMGVQLEFGRSVAAVDSEQVTFKDGSTLRSGTVIWTAGVRAATLADQLPEAQGRAGRLKVTPQLNLPEHPEVFVIGDMAYLEGFNGDKPYPMVAPVAIQQAKQAARNIVALVQGRPPQRFSYFDKGQMATIGRRAAVLDGFGVRLSGVLAWLGWLFLHIVYLTGFRNRLVVLFNWAYSYFTYDRGVRIISGPAGTAAPPDCGAKQVLLSPAPEQQRIEQLERASR